MREAMLVLFVLLTVANAEVSNAETQAIRLVIHSLTIEYNAAKSENRKAAILRDIKRLRQSLKTNG